VTLWVTVPFVSPRASVVVCRSVIGVADPLGPGTPDGMGRDPEARVYGYGVWFMVYAAHKEVWGYRKSTEATGGTYMVINTNFGIPTPSPSLPIQPSG